MPESNFLPFESLGGGIQRAVMPLLTTVENHLVPIGTGFMIAADGLMITAGHVVDQALRTKTRRLNAQGKYYDHYELYALYATDERHSPDSDEFVGGLWPVSRVWRPNSLDIAFCYLTHALINEKPVRFPVIGLSPTLPRVGSHILGLGYYRMAGDSLSEPLAENGVIDYSQYTARSAGVIDAVFPVKRDAGMLNFPCFQTSARFEHGMSGGPVFNESGYAVGVVCSSFPGNPDSESFVSFASQIWPAFGVSIDVALEVGGTVQPVLIYELAQRGIIATDASLSKLRVTLDDAGNRVTAIET